MYLLFMSLIFFHSSPTSQGTKVTSSLVVISSIKVIPGICPNGLGSTYVKLEKDMSENHGWRLTVKREGVVPSPDVMRWWTNLA